MNSGTILEQRYFEANYFSKMKKIKQKISKLFNLPLTIFNFTYSKFLRFSMNGALSRNVT